MQDLKGRRRIMVIGAGGAGKSTFAAELAARTGLPLIHLDQEHWKPGWVETPADEWVARVRELAAGDAWIMDGNYGGTLPIRVARADAIVFFDLPRIVNLWGALERVLLQRWRQRAGLAQGCRERVSLEFLSWIWHFPARSRPRLLRALEGAGPDVLVIRLTRRAQARRLLS